MLLGAESLDELLNRMDAVERVTEQDTRVLREVKAFKSLVKAQKVKLRRARAAQERQVAERAAQRSSIEAQLREREQMLASVREEIAQLEAEAAARQVRLQAQARARIAAAAARARKPGDDLLRRSTSWWRRSRLPPPFPMRATEASWGSRCSTWASRTRGVAPAQVGIRLLRIR